MPLFGKVATESTSFLFDLLRLEGLSGQGGEAVDGVGGDENGGNGKLGGGDRCESVGEVSIEKVATAASAKADDAAVVSSRVLEGDQGPSAIFAQGKQVGDLGQGGQDGQGGKVRQAGHLVRGELEMEDGGAWSRRYFVSNAIPGCVNMLHWCPILVPRARHCFLEISLSQLHL